MPKPIKKLPSKEEILEVFSYLREDGILIRKSNGKQAREFDPGYRVCFMPKSENGERRRYLEHRLIYFLETGEQPEQIDHIDGNKLNNRLSNLRPANKSYNAANKPKYLTNSSSCYKGVFWSKERKRWRAKIKVMGKNIYLGSFKLEKDAAKAYNEAAIKYFGEFAFLNIIEENL